MARNVEIKARTSDLAALRKGVAEVSDSGTRASRATRHLLRRAQRASEAARVR